MLDRLSIYRVGLGETNVSSHIDLAKRLFELKDDFELFETKSNRVLRSAQHTVEIAPASGGIWAIDKTQLWEPSIRPDLPSVDEAVSKANGFVHQGDLLPKLKGPFKYGKPIVGGTHYALRKGGERENRCLDVQIAHPIFVDEFPIVGGGGDFTITLGHQAKVIGFSGCWRPIKGMFEAKLIERRKADEQFRVMTQGLKIDSFDASLAYYSAPAFSQQEFLYPVYVYRATALFGKRRVPLRQIMIPATDFGPSIVLSEAQPLRKKKDRPAFLGKEKAKEQRRSFATRSPWRPWEAGASWIGQSGGLIGSQANAQGFVDEWAAAGWHIDFNWGDHNAWESDWRRNDDTWVDNADFVFYTGHADGNGWVLSPPDDDRLDFSEIGASPKTPGDLWGQSDLEWVIIAACGPLEDDLLAAGGGDVLARWDGAFDGMHILMGYGSVTNDNTDEGRKISQYAKGGSTLIDAWFRTAKEIQPSSNGWPAPFGPTVYVGAMWVGRGSIDPYKDHAWDFGSVSADPTSPTWLAAMWTMC
jgi:hypothetical protein